MQRQPRIRVLRATAVKPVVPMGSVAVVLSEPIITHLPQQGWVTRVTARLRRHVGQSMSLVFTDELAAHAASLRPECELYVTGRPPLGPTDNADLVVESFVLRVPLSRGPTPHGRAA